MYNSQERNGESVPLWDRTSASSESDAWSDELVDVVVIGAGIAGLSVAYELLQTGKNVLVLDKGPLGSGETQRTTAHLASALDDRFTSLEHMHGARGARRAWIGVGAGVFVEI